MSKLLKHPSDVGQVLSWAQICSGWLAAPYIALGDPQGLVFTFKQNHCTNNSIKLIASNIYITGHKGAMLNIFQFKDVSMQY